MTPEEMAIFINDYVPLLSGSAVKIYLYCDSLKNKNEIAAITYSDISEHTGMANSTIKSAIKSLQDIGLIKSPHQDTDGPNVYSPGRHHVVPIRVLSQKSRQALFAKAERPINTTIRERAIQMLPSKYRWLLNRNRLKKALDVLGPDSFSLRDVMQHFDLDQEAIKLATSSPRFVESFKSLKKELIEDNQKAKVELKKKVPKKGQTYSERFEMLMGCHLDKQGNEIPISQWKPIQLVRHFCIVYEKYKGIPCNIAFGKGLSSKELKHMSEILDRLQSNPQTVVEYIEWAFKSKDKVLGRGGVTTNFLAGAVINEFLQQSTTSKSSKANRNDPIDSDFKKWVSANVPEFLKHYDFECWDHLYWIKAAYDEGDTSYGEDKVVEEGIKRKILPVKGNLEFSC